MKRIIVNGTFDILHPGHIKLLNYAKTLGDWLLVAIDSDARVKELKGLTRPINTEEERKFLLENLKAVDEVKIFHSDEELINIVKTCTVMVKGSDYYDKPVLGSDYIQIAFYDRIDEYSTTQKIQNIIGR